MAGLLTNKGAALLSNGTIDWINDTNIKAMLCDSTLTPAVDHNFVSDSGAAGDHEISVSGYADGFGGAGRKTLASKTVTENDTDDAADLDAADPSAWTLAAGATVRYAAIVAEVTDDDATVIIGYIDLGADTPTNGGTVTVQWATRGLFALATT